jgi:hypothetical protein
LKPSEARLPTNKWTDTCRKPLIANVQI